jgi:hypothetical protein
MMEPLNPSAVEVQAYDVRGPGRDAATRVLAAYVRAEQMRTFNQRLQRRLALLAVVWLVLAGASGLIAPPVLAIGLAPLAAAAAWGSLTARRAIRQLHTLLASSQPRATPAT